LQKSEKGGRDHARGFMSVKGSVTDKKITGFLKENNRGGIHGLKERKKIA